MSGGSEEGIGDYFSAEKHSERTERLARRAVLHASECRDAETGEDGYWVPAHVMSDLGETVGVELPEKPAEPDLRERVYGSFGLMRGALEAEREVVGAAGCPECHRVGGHDRDCVNNQS